MTRTLGLVAAALFVATVWLANWLLDTYGLVPVGFGLEAPAGVFAAGAAFTFRDVIHRVFGRPVVVACIVAGGLLSLLISPTFAVASAAAFLASETADMLVYDPLSRRGRHALALGLSNTVGTFVDSMLFLWLAFGSLAFLWGQVVGKSWMTLLALVLLFPTRELLRSRGER